MNRIFGMITLAALLAVGSASCKKNTETKASFSFELPAVEGFSADEGRAYIDLSDGKMKWYDGDMMMIYSVDGTNTTPQTELYVAVPGSTGKTSTNFVGNAINAGSLGYFAFYPASKAVSVSADNCATFKVESTQTYNHELNIYGGRGIMDPRGVVAASTCTVDNGSANPLTLNHIFGFVNVRVKDLTTGGDTKYVRSVTIKDNRLNLTGEMTIEIPAITTDRLNYLKDLGASYASGSMDAEVYMSNLSAKLQEMGYSSRPNGDEVTLNCEGDAVPIDGSNTYFIIPLRPGALIGSFTITVTFDDADHTSLSKTYSDKSYIVRPGRFSNIQFTIE
jgi:hypothetical protein